MPGTLIVPSGVLSDTEIIKATFTPHPGQVSFFVDGKLYDTRRSITKVFVFAFDTTTVQDGNHVITARPIYGNNKPVIDATANVVVRNTPVVGIVDPVTDVGDGQIALGAYMEGPQTYSHLYPEITGGWSSAPYLDPGTNDAWAFFENNIGKKVKFCMHGRPCFWDAVFDGETKDSLNLADARGAINVLDMSTLSYPLTDITAGKQDAAIDAWALGAKNWAKPFVLRLNCEMNGTWYNYGYQAAQNPIAFTDAWKHIFDRFQAVGATNVSWHWCPNVDPDKSHTSLDKLYPGDDYVHKTGFTGYNHGYANEPTEVSFNSIFFGTYQWIDSIAPNKKMMIGEIASAEGGQLHKVDFLNQMFSSLPVNYPKVRSFCWFNWYIFENNLYWDWPVESSQSALFNFKQHMTNPAIVGR